MLRAWLVFGDSIAACGKEDFHTAKKFYQGWLKSSYHAALKTWLLPISAVVLAHEGEIKRAVEIIGLILTHPLSPSGWMEKWSLLTRLRADLEAELGSEAYAAAWERGKALELEAILQEVLAESQDE
jgi:hypothetical protein